MPDHAFPNGLEAAAAAGSGVEAAGSGVEAAEPGVAAAVVLPLLDGMLPLLTTTPTYYSLLHEQQLLLLYGMLPLLQCKVRCTLNMAATLLNEVVDVFLDKTLICKITRIPKSSKTFKHVTSEKKVDM